MFKHARESVRMHVYQVYNIYITFPGIIEQKIFYLGKYRYLFFYRFFPCLAYRVCMKNTKNMKNMVKKKKTGMKIMFFCSNVRILCLNHFHIHRRVECNTTTGACMHINTLFHVLKKSNFLYFGKFSNIFPTWKSMKIVGKSPTKKK